MDNKPDNNEITLVKITNDLKSYVYRSVILLLLTYICKLSRHKICSHFTYKYSNNILNF